VEALVQGHDLPVDLGDGLFDTCIDAGCRLPLVGADRHKELSDLVGVLARSGDFDRACPVVVEVAERVSQLLNVKASQL